MGQRMDTGHVVVKSATKQHAAQISAKARQIQGHKRRKAAGVPCVRCKICFPETGKRPSHQVLSESSRCLEETLPKPDAFAERLDQLAEAGTSEQDAALILNLSFVEFQSKLAELYGQSVSWAAMLQKAKAKVRADLIASALRAARLGDWKPYLSLEKAGISLALVEQSDTDGTSSKAIPSTLAEIDAELAKLEEDNASKRQASNLKLDLSGFAGVRQDKNINLD